MSVKFVTIRVLCCVLSYRVFFLVCLFLATPLYPPLVSPGSKLIFSTLITLTEDEGWSTGYIIRVATPLPSTFRLVISRRIAISDANTGSYTCSMKHVRQLAYWSGEKYSRNARKKNNRIGTLITTTAAYIAS